MATLFDDGARLEHDDAIYGADGGEAVGDEDGRALLEDKLRRLLDLHLREGIDAGGGLVEHDDARVAGGVGERLGIGLGGGRLQRGRRDGRRGWRRRR